MLRKRYWPGWIGSWIGRNVDPLVCEDSIVVVSFFFASCFAFERVYWFVRI